MEPPTTSTSQSTPPTAAPHESSQATANPALSSHVGRVPAEVPGSGVNSHPANDSASHDDGQLNNSQESIVSNLSFTTKPPGLFPSSSNVSTATVQTVDTDVSSPLQEQLNSLAQKAIDAQQAQFQRPHTPGLTNGSKDGSSEHVSSASTSPMSLDTPYTTKGTKRTASGAIKSAISVQTAIGTSQLYDSIDSPVNKSPKELAQTLKTRLSYAMYKVQHGLEHHNLDELEAMTDRSMPSTPARSRAGTGTSRRLSMFSEASEPYLQSPATMEFPNGTPRLLQDLASGDYRSSKTSVARTTNGRSLQPAAPISSRSYRRSMSSKAPPMLSTAGIPRSTGDYPTTPQRHGILRMPSKQDEKDAVDTLLFMSSPNNSNNMRYSNSTQASPLRSEFPVSTTEAAGVAVAKKVVFDGSNGRMIGQAPR